MEWCKGLIKHLSGFGNTLIRVEEFMTDARMRHGHASATRHVATFLALRHVSSQTQHTEPAIYY